MKEALKPKPIQQWHIQHRHTAITMLKEDDDENDNEMQRR